ncbi:MAG: hypothetical protein LBB76_08425 [Azoarcus sp.]|nr:hypothetical protein [Azoarcus sp.]
MSGNPVARSLSSMRAIAIHAVGKAAIRPRAAKFADTFPKREVRVGDGKITVCAAIRGPARH